MADNRPDPTQIMELATGYWASAALLAANELNVFGALGEGSRTAEEVAEACGASVRAASMLLDACVGLGLLVKSTDDAEAQYANASASAAFLVPGRPGYLGNALRWSADQFALWGNLAESVRRNTPATDPEKHLGEDPEQTRNFVLGMHNRALGVARGVVPFLDLSGTETLLDVGGGPGTYATLLAQKYPGLQVTVLDLPEVAAIARELIAEAGMSERVQTLPGNAVTGDYGINAYDAVLFSGVLHQMAPDTIRQMLHKARRALKPGGRVIISDIMLEPGKNGPPFATLFSLQMLLSSNEGAVFSAEECASWLAEAGFAQATARRLPPPLPYYVVTGRVEDAGER
jgi:ubiquinone/menaquinone biosynthesis C-methylase UbiE